VVKRRARAARRRAVFLDRDGVLNRTAVRNGKPYAPRVAADFRLLPGVARAVTALKNAVFLVIVVTNQPDLGHGLIAPEALAAMHAHITATMPVDKIMVCPHRQDAGCSCRKPKPGMMLRAQRRWNIDLARSYMVGDRWNDVVAGNAAGIYTIHIDRRYTESVEFTPNARVRSLPEAARHILAHWPRRGAR
jgi:D-glycero-D-manno-heptose 1,7-bisphosphate phosphatase